MPFNNTLKSLVLKLHLSVNKKQQQQKAPYSNLFPSCNLLKIIPLLVPCFSVTRLSLKNHFNIDFPSSVQRKSVSFFSEAFTSHVGGVGFQLG